MKSAKTDLSVSNIASPGDYSIALRLLKLRLKEWLLFDTPRLNRIIGFCGVLLGFVFYILGKTRNAFAVFSRIHSSACSPWASRVVEQTLRTALEPGREKPASGFRRIFVEHLEQVQPTSSSQRFFDDPHRFLGPMAIVLKESKRGEKGVISILYSYALPIFAKIFDVNRIARDYYLVLEPSWSGYCNLDVLCYSSLEYPVFVQAYEPRDNEFIQRLISNLIPVPVMNNWWVDHRVFKPVPNVSKDIDVVMVAGWASFKRHHEFFRGLMKLRKMGVALKTILIGYPQGRGKDSIFELATYYGIRDQLEIYELITPQEVNHHINRAKVNVIWSRREGANRAVIEGLFAGVPFILRKGHNYGYHYPYVNECTGCYSSEDDLPERLLWMVEHYQNYSPRDWASQNMSCEKATRIVSASISALAANRGGSWTENLVVKVNGLHGQQYWNPADKQKFSSDYDFLISCIRQ